MLEYQDDEKDKIIAALTLQRDKALDLLGQLCMNDTFEVRAKILNLLMEVQMHKEARY